jgi:hypothetical protein
MKRNETKTVEVLERFSFTDGTRFAYVTYRISVTGERQCVSVREVYSGIGL